MKFCFVSYLFFALSFTLSAQHKESYPDSLKGVVLKFEPLSFLYDHLSAGVEVPIGRTFLDVNIGASGLGFNNYQDRKGGFVTKVGVKIPLSMNTPFSFLYVMPEVGVKIPLSMNTLIHAPSTGSETRGIHAPCPTGS